MPEAYVPQYLQRWKYPECYMGPSHEGCYVFPEGQSRGADTLTRSNYRVALAELLKLNTEDEDGNITVYDVRDSHFLCGWIEYILIHESNGPALELADKMADKIENSYACLCEHDWSALEDEEAQKAWKTIGMGMRIECCVNARLSIFAARRDSYPRDDQGTVVQWLTRP